MSSSSRFIPHGRELPQGQELPEIQDFRIVQDFDTVPAFDVVAPAVQRAPFVFNSPHSGRCYPAAFLAASRLGNPAIRRSEDGYVDDLFRPVVELGVPLMRAHFPRAFLDVNREPYELDPKMFTGRLPAFANVRSPRVAGGLGTIARIVADAEEIYAGPLDVEDALQRIEAFYKPYHATLGALIARTRASFGTAVLIDCHSMPSSVRGQDPRIRPDMIIGDRHGTSCDPAISETASEILSDLGFIVARNRPYAGGFITEHYGRPAEGIHALQIEVNRSLYMDERRCRPTAALAGLSCLLTRFAAELMARFGYGRDDGSLSPLAAE